MTAPVGAEPRARSPGAESLEESARALASGDALAALKRVALRDDPPALALRGIAGSKNNRRTANLYTYEPKRNYICARNRRATINYWLRPGKGGKYCRGST